MKLILNVILHINLSGGRGSVLGLCSVFRLLFIQTEKIHEHDLSWNQILLPLIINSTSFQHPFNDKKSYEKV